MRPARRLNVGADRAPPGRIVLGVERALEIAVGIAGSENQYVVAIPSSVAERLAARHGL